MRTVGLYRQIDQKRTNLSDSNIITGISSMKTSSEPNTPSDRCAIWPFLCAYVKNLNACERLYNENGQQATFLTMP